MLLFFKNKYGLIFFIASLLYSNKATSSTSDSVIRILDTITVISRQWPNKKELLPYSYTIKNKKEFDCPDVNGISPHKSDFKLNFHKDSIIETKKRLNFSMRYTKDNL